MARLAEAKGGPVTAQGTAQATARPAEPAEAEAAEKERKSRKPRKMKSTQPRRINAGAAYAVADTTKDGTTASATSVNGSSRGAEWGAEAAAALAKLVKVVPPTQVRRQPRWM